MNEKEIIEKFIMQQAVWSGKRMVPFINDGELQPEQITPNGIDFTVDKVFRQMSNVVLANDDYPEFTDKGSLGEMLPSDNIYGFPPDSWFLQAGYYTIQWAEKIEVPPNCIGLLIPRSTLLRTCATVYTAVWDRGYKGIGQSGLQVFSAMGIQRGTRLAQMIFIEAVMDGSLLYEGQYQGENLDAKEKNKKEETKPKGPIRIPSVRTYSR